MIESKCFTNPAECDLFLTIDCICKNCRFALIFLHTKSNIFACSEHFFASLSFFSSNSVGVLFTFGEIDSNENFIGRAFCSIVFWQDNYEKRSLYNRNWLHCCRLLNSRRWKWQESSINWGAFIENDA